MVVRRVACAALLGSLAIGLGACWPFGGGGTTTARVSPTPSAIAPSVNPSLDPNNPNLHPKKGNVKVSGTYSGTATRWIVTHCSSNQAGTVWVFQGGSDTGTVNLVIDVDALSFTGPGAYSIPSSAAADIIAQGDNGGQLVQTKAASGTIVVSSGSNGISITKLTFSQGTTSLVLDGTVSCVTPYP